MAYTKIVFQNSPSTATPLNAENLNHMDDQIALNDQRLTVLEGAHVASFNGRTNDVMPESGDYNIGQIAPLSGAQVGQVPVVVNHGTEQDPELVFEMGAGGGGGHSIIDSEGNTMPQESAMQFADFHVTDDETNGRTIVENIKEVASANYSSETEDGMYLIPDGEGAVIEPASDDYVEVEQITGGTKTYGQLLDDLFSLIDSTKINQNTTINHQYSATGFDTFHRSQTTNNKFTFTCTYVDNNTSIITVALRSSGSTLKTSDNGTISDYSSTVASGGTKITLYYGNKKAVVDLQTTANRCWMSNGESVESAIVPSGYSTDGLTFTDCTLVNGGYFKIGKMVVLNIRVKVTASSSVTKAYINLPNKITPSTTLIGLTAQQSTDDLPPIFSVISIGKIFMKNTTDNKDYVINGAWLA